MSARRTWKYKCLTRTGVRRDQGWVYCVFRSASVVSMLIVSENARVVTYRVYLIL